MKRPPAEHAEQAKEDRRRRAATAVAQTISVLMEQPLPEGGRNLVMAGDEITVSIGINKATGQATKKSRQAFRNLEYLARLRLEPAEQLRRAFEGRELLPPREKLPLVSLEIVQDDFLVLEETTASEPQDLSETDLTKRAEFHALADKALKSGLSISEFRKAIEDKLTAKAQATARETTARAKATPRPGGGSTAEQIFAEAAAKSSRRNTRYVFTEAELRDPEAVNRARDTLSDSELARSNGKEISDEQRRAYNRAKALIRRLSQLDVA